MKTLESRMSGAAPLAGLQAALGPRSEHATPLPDRAALHPPWVLYGVIAFEITCQMLLLFPIFATARVLLRTAAFGGNLALLFVLRRSQKNHPSSTLALIVIAIIFVSILHPTTVSGWAGVATAALYSAILAPIFWVQRVRVDMRTARNVLFLLWAFNTTSALVGALQMYFPGHLQPALATGTAFDDDAYVESLKIELASGERVLRPMGLTDTPGGAAFASLYSVVLGVGFLLGRPRLWFRAVLIASMALALVSLYLSQVRSVFVMLVISLLSMGLPFVLQRRTRRFLTLVAVIVAVGAAGFTLAVSLGGDLVLSRLSSLWEDSPGTVYYTNRGKFLEYTLIELLPQYPLGVGLGRWGMINSYFGERLSGPRPMWAEINWTGWLYDGGLPLMLAYAGAIYVALRTSLRIARGPSNAPNESLQRWAAIVFGYGVGALASTFNACIFASTGGVDFWILNATIFAASDQLGDGT